MKNSVCKNCAGNFNVTEWDLNYYKRIDVPVPAWCPSCRHLRRHGHINDYVFYSRTCDGCKKSFVSIFPQESPYVVFCQDCWYSEQRDDKEQGRAYDPKRSFFDQFNDLMHSAPQLGLIGGNNQNCSYCESVANCKDCYLISESSNCEDCYFSYWIQKSTDCLDCAYTHECERSYECIDCFNCYGLQYSKNSTSCSDSFFLDNCISCKNCFFCTNLRQKEYYIENQPFSKEEYFHKLKQLLPESFPKYQVLKAKFEDYLHTQPRKHLQVENIENCSGDYIRNAKNCSHVYHCYDAEECAYGEHVWRGAKWCVDANTAGRNAELVYESTNCGIDTYDVKFSRYCWSSHHVEYCNQCHSGRNLFGCVSLKPGASYCILNVQYKEKDYFQLVSEIKGKMRKEGEYGEFFPLSISLFGYNNTPSYAEHAYSKNEVLERGWKWEETSSGTYGRGTCDVATLPANLATINTSLAQEIFTCKNCERNFRFITQELDFYQKGAIPLPHCCPDCRQRARLALRNKKNILQVHCAECNTPIATTLDPARNATIMCSPCYRKMLY